MQTSPPKALKSGAPLMPRKPTNSGWQSIFKKPAVAHDNGRSMPAASTAQVKQNVEYVLPDHLQTLALDTVRNGDDGQKQLAKVSNGLGSWSVLPRSLQALNAGARLAPTRPVAYGDALVTTRGDGKLVIEINHGRPQEDAVCVASLSTQRQGSWAMRLEAGPNNQLVRYRSDNKAFKVRDGVYPFVIDQNGACLIPFAAGTATTRTGGHGTLAGAYGVLFAGELTVGTVQGKQQVLLFNNKSGNYLTPSQIPTFEKQARAHDLLKEVPFEPVKFWDSLTKGEAPYGFAEGQKAFSKTV